VFPSTAALLQHKLGNNNGAAAFDVQAVCSGFVYAMTIAEKFIRSGSHKRALVVGAEVFSRILDWTDRGTCVLFGDGAGAVVLEAADVPGILASAFHADGSHHGILSVPGQVCGGTVTGDPFLRMDGQAVFKFAVRVLAEVAHEVLDAAGMTATQVDWLIPHQANVRILQSTEKAPGSDARWRNTAVPRRPRCRWPSMRQCATTITRPAPAAGRFSGARPCSNSDRSFHLVATSHAQNPTTMKFALVFPGQGSQSVGMMAAYGDEPVIRATFDEASTALGRDLWQLVADGPAEALSQTVHANHDADLRHRRVSPLAGQGRARAGHGGRPQSGRILGAGGRRGAPAQGCRAAGRTARQGHAGGGAGRRWCHGRRHGP
jgi:hypothetical protein